MPFWKRCAWFSLAVIITVFAVLALKGRTFDAASPGVARAKAEMLALCVTLRAYRADCGAMPPSDNSAVVRALAGDNPRRTTYFTFKERNLDASGRFVDPWGSPYRFDLRDPANPKVWSPGKDKKDEPDDPHSDDICSWR